VWVFLTTENGLMSRLVLVFFAIVQHSSFSLTVHSGHFNGAFCRPCSSALPWSTGKDTSETFRRKTVSSSVYTMKTSLHPAQDSETKLFTCSEIQDAARRVGMEITLNSLGPFYRSVIRLAKKEEADPKGKIIGFTSGTINAPLLRQDTMKIYGVNTGNQLSRMATLKNSRGWTSPTAFGLSLLLGAYGVRYAFDQGCTKAELLAINDNERQHAILQRHYQRLGLKPVREVTEDLSCIPGTSSHLLSSP
jgi:hypothetical protein